MDLSKEQQVQDNYYSFPYHYTVKFNPNFSMIQLYDWGLNYASAVEYILGKISVQDSKQEIIDIGCGEGRLTRELKLKFGNANVAGVDYSPRPIDLAKALNADLDIDFEAKNIICERHEKTYDTATLMEVYEHIHPDDSEAFLKGISNLLSTNGVLHLTVPHKNIPIAPHHFRHFNSELLISELEKYFIIDEVVPFERTGSLRRWLLRIFANKYYVINNNWLNNKMYKFYKSRLFYTSESKCQRLYVRCHKK